MDDATEPGDPAGADGTADATEATDAEAATSQNVALGVVFGVLGLALTVTLDEVRAAGLPFLVLGVVFFAMGIREAKGQAGGPPTPEGPPTPDGDGPAPIA
jgi:hypothetical protein